MKEGSSGGGWVLKRRPGQLGRQPQRLRHEPELHAVAGTYFGDTAYKLWSKAGGGIAKGRQKKIKACKSKPKAKARQLHDEGPEVQAGGPLVGGGGAVGQDQRLALRLHPAGGDRFVAGHDLGERLAL